MRGIDVFYQLRYFLSLNVRNAYIQGRREYLLPSEKTFKSSVATRNFL
jgi:hypothetical protein